MKSIIELARKVGLLPNHDIYEDDLEEFTAFIRAQALEEAAGVCDPEPSLPNEAYTVHNNKVTMRRCAASIRALKGETK
jgi:hypothetical protein